MTPLENIEAAISNLEAARDSLRQSQSETLLGELRVIWADPATDEASKAGLSERALWPSIFGGDFPPPDQKV